MKRLNTKIARLNYLLVILTALLFLALSFAARAADSISVMVIDTGYAPFNPFLSRIHDTGNDDSVPMDIHGSHISSIVIHGKLNSFNIHTKISDDEICKSVKVYHCNYFSTKNLDTSIQFKNDYLVQLSSMDYAETTKNCFKKALELNVDFVNYSSVGPARLESEKRLIQQLVKNGTKVIVSSGNEGYDLSKSQNCEITKKNKSKAMLFMSAYPACYDIPGLIVVGSSVETKKYNYGIPNMVFEDVGPMLGAVSDYKFGELTGTSQAAAMHTHKLIKNECKKRGLK